MCVDVFHCQVNQPKFNQRRISSAKFLGELYNYRMVESAVIFRTLFSFISFGVNTDGSPSPLDPPEHLFRIRMVCTLLDTCGQYFDRGSSKKKLDCFLIYFQVSFSLSTSQSQTDDTLMCDASEETSFKNITFILSPVVTFSAVNDILVCFRGTSGGRRVLMYGLKISRSPSILST